MKRTLTAVRVAKRSVCPCGFPSLNDKIQIGEEYLVDRDNVSTAIMICGGCHASLHLWCVYAESRTGERPGYIPSDLFDYSEEKTA